MSFVVSKQPTVRIFMLIYLCMKHKRKTLEFYLNLLPINIGREVFFLFLVCYVWLFEQSDGVYFWNFILEMKSVYVSLVFFIITYELRTSVVLYHVTLLHRISKMKSYVKTFGKMLKLLRCGFVSKLNLRTYMTRILIQLTLKLIS